MAAPRLVLFLVGLLLAAGVPWGPAEANHLPTPPDPCHPRGCSEWATIATPNTYDELRAPLADLAHGRLYAVSRNGANGMSLMAFGATDGQLAYRVDWASPLGYGMTPYGAALSPDGATVVVTGAVYTRTTPERSGPDLLVVAFSAATGNTRWMSTFDENNTFDEGFAVAVDDQHVYALGYSDRRDEVCYAGGSSFAERPQAVAFDLGTGALVWHARENSTWRSYGAVGSRVIVGNGGAVHFAQSVHACGPERPGPSANDTTMLWTVDGATGATAWIRSFTEARAADNVFSSVIASPDRSRLFVGGWANHLAPDGAVQGTLGAFAASDGRTLWSDIVPTVGDRTVVQTIALSPDGSRLLVGSSDHAGPGSPSMTSIQLRDPATGATLWSGVSSAPWNGESSAAAFSQDGSRAYVSGAGNATTYTASLEPSTGRVVWTYTVPVVAGRYHGAPLALYPTSDGLHVLSIAPSQDLSGERDLVVRSAAVIAPPERPQAAAEGGNVPAVIRVSWTPPADDGGRPITQYIVSRGNYSDDDFVPIALVDGDTRAIDDGGREPSVYYFYKVAAVNDVGIGPPSQLVAATALDLPGAPRVVHAAAGANPLAPSIVLTWRAPNSDGGTPITSYTIVRHEPSGAVVALQVVGPGVRSFEDKHVRLLAPYSYSVTAANRLGAGPPGDSNCMRASPVGTVTTLMGAPCYLADELAPVEARSPV